MAHSLIYAFSGGVDGSFKKLIIGRMTKFFSSAESRNIGVLFSQKIMFIRPLDHFLLDFEKR